MRPALLEDRSPGAGENEIGEGARGLRMRRGLHDRQRVGDAVGERGVAGKWHERITARDGFGAVEESDVGLAGVDARQQILFGKDLRRIFIGAEDPPLAVAGRATSSSPSIV